MRITTFLFVSTMMLVGCDDNRYFEKNTDFKEAYWLNQDKPSFDFEVPDTLERYNLYITLRNESNYPNSNLYFTYYLLNEKGEELKRDLVSKFLFDKKTGEPLGKSGLGDIYDHRFLLFDKYSFPAPGKYSIRYEQFMRADTLPGILSVGLRIEKDGDQ